KIFHVKLCTCFINFRQRKKHQRSARQLKKNQRSVRWNRKKNSKKPQQFQIYHVQGKRKLDYLEDH
ncbi:hypothetical protein NPIL_110371, partial [Nephila pilipes]